MDGLKTCFISRDGGSTFSEKCFFNGWTTDGSAIIQMESGICNVWAAHLVKFPVIDDYFSKIMNKFPPEEIKFALSDENLQKLIVDYFLERVYHDYTQADCFGAIKMFIYEKLYGHR
jgi:hypothetical protein